MRRRQRDLARVLCTSHEAARSGGVWRPALSVERFAEAIDAVFARSNLSHLQGFELSYGRLIGYPDATFEPTWLAGPLRARRRA